MGITPRKTIEPVVRFIQESSGPEHQQVILWSKSCKGILPEMVMIPFGWVAVVSKTLSSTCEVWPNSLRMRSGLFRPNVSTSCQLFWGSGWGKGGDEKLQSVLRFLTVLRMVICVSRGFQPFQLAQLALLPLCRSVVFYVPHSYPSDSISL